LKWQFLKNGNQIATKKVKPPSHTNEGDSVRRAANQKVADHWKIGVQSAN